MRRNDQINAIIAKQFAEYCHQIYVRDMWAKSDGPNDPSFYIQMSEESAHAAYVLNELAVDCFELDFYDIARHMTSEERYAIAFNETDDAKIYEMMCLCSF